MIKEIRFKRKIIRDTELEHYVFREYRLNEDLTIDPDTELMTYTPKVWAKFIPEESIADPKDVRVTMPSIPMLVRTHFF